MILYKSDMDVANADVQEAESIRYGNTAFMIVPLSSGRVAVLGHMRSLHAITETLSEAVEASRSIEFLVWRRAAAEKETKPNPGLIRGLNVESLDL
jgi:hypothetical protein